MTPSILSFTVNERGREKGRGFFSCYLLEWSVGFGGAEGQGCVCVSREESTAELHGSFLFVFSKELGSGIFVLLGMSVLIRLSFRGVF